MVVVTGHERHEVRAGARAGCKVRFVANPDYAEGLSTSLKAGLAALPAEVEGVLVWLGDMPRVRSALVDRLIAAFDPLEGRAHRGPDPARQARQPGPVVATRFLPEMREIAGDVGARHLIGEHDDEVVEIEMEDDAALLDIDTPEALAALLETAS